LPSLPVRRIAAVLVLLAPLLGGCAADPVVGHCAAPAPTTAAGYAALWDLIPDAQWAGGDIGISVPLPDGRSVWLYGDSWRPGAADHVYAVHSAAIVQDRGCVHASNGGAQLLTDEDATHAFWIASGAYSGGHLVLRARCVEITGRGAFAFADAGFSRTFTVAVSARGDLRVLRRSARRYSPAPAPGRFFTAAGRATTKPDRRHFFYSRHAHPEAHLEGGRLLVTLAQGWDDGTLHVAPSWKSQNAPLWLEAPR
jgi:hypothetical protein